MPSHISICGAAFRRARGRSENTLRDLGAYLPLYKAAVDGKWRDAKIYLDQDPLALTAKISIASETALHIAVGTGKRGHEFVEKLVKEMSPEDLALTDQHGETAFSIAAVVGNIHAAKILYNKNPDLPNISGKYGFPIHKAAQFSQEKMVNYLLDVTGADIQPNPFTGDMGGRLLIDVIAADFFDKEKDGKEQEALMLVKELCKEISELDDSKVFSLLQQALHDAAKLGIPEIIEEIVEIFPPAIWFTDKDNYNVFQLAILNRQEAVFNLIFQLTDFKVLITRFIDSEDNNMLHLVGKLPPSDRLSLVSGPALLLQREIQWYKEVEKHISPAQRVAKNKAGKTPKMVFTEEHQELMKDGAKWIKKTASSSAVFATLIATVAFAGGMHVPGGTDTSGLPYLLHEQAFTIFTIADAVSLVFSIFSIITFLSIIVARYSEDDFHHILPRKLKRGIGVLFCSIIVMLIAFCVALYLVFTPTKTKNQFLAVLYVLMIVILVMSVIILYQIVKPMNGSNMFVNNKDRILH
ncbi:hypothetical protein RND81_11G194600 [Saponaria officinalis]|uniref:PGG domain-containing protein n=1 Tax=Saponaria officinalis TaxID=3572 RepID=A0AAW1HNZ5_SAPOF